MIETKIDDEVLRVLLRMNDGDLREVEQVLRSVVEHSWVRTFESRVVFEVGEGSGRDENVESRD